MNFKVASIAERPELRADAETLIAKIWPQFLQQDQVGAEYWGHLYELFPEYQFCLLTADDETFVAVGNSIPLAWDESEEQLPEGGWRWAITQGFKDHDQGLTPKNQCALSITIHPDFLGQGVSSIMLNAMKDIGRDHQLGRIIAPVRPNLKNRYPLTPMEQYVTWQNDAHLPFDAWLRVHHRLGARIVNVCAKSMRIVGTVDDWETWTGLPMPQDGLYLVDGALTPIKVSREKNIGVYIEPNVWMIGDL